MKISVTVTGYIDVPDDWDDGQYSALDIANYRYSNQLTVEDALQEIAQKMASHPDDVEVSIRPREVREPLTCEGCYWQTHGSFGKCIDCIREKTDHYRRPPEGEEDI